MSMRTVLKVILSWDFTSWLRCTILMQEGAKLTSSRWLPKLTKYCRIRKLKDVTIKQGLSCTSNNSTITKLAKLTQKLTGPNMETSAGKRSPETNSTDQVITTSKRLGATHEKGHISTIKHIIKFTKRKESISIQGERNTNDWRRRHGMVWLCPWFICFLAWWRSTVSLDYSSEESQTTKIKISRINLGFKEPTMVVL